MINHLVRVTCYVQRFIGLCRKTNLIKELNPLENEVFYNPSKEEITVAENYWIRWAQLELPTYKSRLEKLVPFIDMLDVQRVSGRLRESYIFDYDHKHPVLLPPDNSVTVAQWLSASNIFRQLCYSTSEFRRFESRWFCRKGFEFAKTQLSLLNR